MEKAKPQSEFDFFFTVKYFRIMFHFYFKVSVLKLTFYILYTASSFLLWFNFQSEYISFYRYHVIRKVAMCQFGTSDESFQNHYLAGTRITVKLALQAGPSSELVDRTIYTKKVK
jgi:hypothetical protein